MLIINVEKLFGKTVNAEHVYAFCRGPAYLLAGPLGLEHAYRQTHPVLGIDLIKQTDLWVLG